MKEAMVMDLDSGRLGRIAALVMPMKGVGVFGA